MAEKGSSFGNFISKTLNFAINGVNFAGKSLWYAAATVVVLVIPLQLAMEADNMVQAESGPAAVPGIIPELK
eukprot:TRINITY_DN3224_c0_g1_i1.p3 TRINITY_DN3224_c0_g1~~TRINITY_DN3224_c0_g1_i1.p3  ORF type:complete len:72 (-),score=12.49 TRINITY_DN3224_c0_g1_i1:54-269(-)